MHVMSQILDTAVKLNPRARRIWEEKILINKDDEKKTLAVLQEANKVLEDNDALHLCNFVLDNTNSKSLVRPL